jgi:hypothetical protein
VLAENCVVLGAGELSTVTVVPSRPVFVFSIVYAAPTEGTNPLFAVKVNVTPPEETE